MDDTPTFGIWLKRRRKALDLTQAALAQLVGCSVVSIRKFEGDEQPPSRQLAELLATQLQIPPNERATFIQFARVGLDSAPPPLPLPAEARLPQPMGATPAPEHATPTAAPRILATHATPSIRDLPRWSGGALNGTPYRPSGPRRARGTHSWLSSLARRASVRPGSPKSCSRRRASRAR